MIRVILCCLMLAGCRDDYNGAESRPERASAQ